MLDIPGCRFKLLSSAISLLLLGPSTLVSGFSYKKNVKFDYCWNQTVSFFNTTDYSDKRQFFVWDRTHSYRLNLSHPLLTLSGCESTCGDGYELWEWDDTLLRITMWILPAIVLLVHFNFAPLGVANIFAVITHIVGDPLDTLWSMMTRQEVNRRLYECARKYSDGSDGSEPKHIATIWSAYDELGWKDASSHFAETLEHRDPNTPSQIRHNRPEQNIFHRGLTILNARMGGPRGYENLPTEGRRPTSAELYYIQLASHRLASNRSESQLTTWFAIIGLLGGLFAAFIRTYMKRLNNQTGHTIAIVALFFILIPIVKISGNIGCFSSTSIAVDIIQELHRNLKVLNPEGPQLFPALRFDPTFGWDYASEEGQAVEMQENRDSDVPTREFRNLESWPDMASWAGMNNSWRPCKQILVKDFCSTSDLSSGFLFFLSFFFIMCAYIPALVLSYRTPTVGFSCRSMAWTLVLIAWLTSAAADQILKRTIPSARSLWSWTIIKDSFFAIFFSLIIIAAQLGLFNNCWCRTGVLGLRGNAYADIGPQSRRDWLAGWPLWVATPLSFFLLILALILTLGRVGGNARTLLYRSEKDRQSGLLKLTQNRVDLENARELPRLLPGSLQPLDPIAGE
ncbi:MAG: hypothetical protein M1840_006737 [Geoglossum simile]|nr:MAG: hypothetical protein M1840_006737 [Geoglossum simile]